MNTNSNFKKLFRMLQNRGKEAKKERKVKNHEDGMKSSNRGLMGMLGEGKGRK